MGACDHSKLERSIPVAAASLRNILLQLVTNLGDCHIATMLACVKKNWYAIGKKGHCNEMECRKDILDMIQQNSSFVVILEPAAPVYYNNYAAS